MLAVLGGKSSPSAGDVKSILDSCGIEADSDSLSRLISAVGDKDINEVVAQGMSKLSSVPSGGAGVGGDSGGGGAGGGEAAASSAPAAEEAKEDTDEEDNDMGFDLFD